MENRGVGCKTDMERGRKKEERKTHTFTTFSHSMATCLSVHTFYGNIEYLLLTHIPLDSLPLSISFPLFI